MNGYIFEIRESDGNDCTVYDYLMEAESVDAAREELAAFLEGKAIAGNWEFDGDSGYYFPCECENEEPEEPTFPCSQCASCAINGVNCHESGCPIDAEYRRELRRYKRFECDGHGGVMIDYEPDVFDSLELAEQEHRKNRYYHLVL